MSVQLSLLDGPAATERYLRRFRCGAQVERPRGSDTWSTCDQIDTEGAGGPPGLIDTDGAYVDAQTVWHCRACLRRAWDVHERNLHARAARLERIEAWSQGRLWPRRFWLDEAAWRRVMHRLGRLTEAAADGAA